MKEQNLFRSCINDFYILTIGVMFVLIVLIWIGICLQTCSVKSEPQPQPTQNTIPQLHSVEWPESDFRGVLHTLINESFPVNNRFSVQETPP